MRTPHPALRTPHVSKSAFTLIEMMIAIALGLVIIYVAVAGVRTASQTISVANRLSLENSLLRSGYYAAQEQLDFWTNLDDPTRPAAERPLTRITSGHGMPFTSMNALRDAGEWPQQGTVPRFPSSGGFCQIMPRPPETSPPDGVAEAHPPASTSGWEDDQGWDPTVSWSPHDPRTWTRANLAEKWIKPEDYACPGVLPPVMFGRYALFAYTGTPGALTPFTIKADTNAPVPAAPATAPAAIGVTYSGYPTDTVHHWYYRQAKALSKAMGYAAFCEYLPPNAIYTWYTDTSVVPDRGLTAGGIDRLCVEANTDFCNGDGGQMTSRGIYRQTYQTSFGYLNPLAPSDYNNGAGGAVTDSDLAWWYYKHFDTDYTAMQPNLDPHATWDGVRDLKWFLGHLNFPQRQLVLRPSQWPDVQVSVGRFIKNGRHLAMAKIRRVAPLTGEVIELTWSGLGTTLRGARQQRLRDGSGWARWDNGGTTIDANLDTP
ncbi:MAG: prepilin-type N-terminal cleavage/methylation domain-containing protein [Planctomycetes bacterium]|nr:prepilin-type N-terminal cleavage/methylation domain-containing protein [Planctomycetota bacterium]